MYRIVICFPLLDRGILAHRAGIADKVFALPPISRAYRTVHTISLLQSNRQIHLDKVIILLRRATASSFFVLPDYIRTCNRSNKNFTDITIRSNLSLEQ
jgi:hypothetical protein